MSIEYKVLLVGAFNSGALENAYYDGFIQNDCNVECFDIHETQNSFARFNNIGRIFNKFVPVEPWLRKANRLLVLKVRDYNPDLIIVFGQNRVLPGALAQIKSTSNAKLLFVWQDSMIFLNTNIICSLPLYDIVFTYSLSNIKSFKSLGANIVEWLPLAANPNYHYPVEPNASMKCDLAFVGQWRPEREDAIQVLLDNIENINIKVWGLDWLRYSKNKKIKSIWQGSSIYGEEFSKVICSATVNLNVIDDTNYPAANMRFFEIPSIGGCQISSICPEMSTVFQHKKDVLYYEDNKGLIDIMNAVLKNEIDIEFIKKSGHEKVLLSHTYKYRANQILKLSQI